MSYRDCRVVGITMLIGYMMWTVHRWVSVIGVILLTVHLHVVCTYVFVMYFWRSCVDCMFRVYTHVCCIVIGGYMLIVLIFCVHVSGGIIGDFWLIIHV